jgi:hypothetical protein
MLMIRGETRIRGEIRPEADGTLKFILYDEEAMNDMAKTMIGKDIVIYGRIIGKVTHAEVIDGKIMWEGDVNYVLP